MFNGNIPYKEIFCEHHEDILALREDDTYVGIQIKTRQLSDGPFELGDDAINNSLVWFIKLQQQFPLKFSEFIIVSNCSFRNDETGKSLIHLLYQLKKEKTDELTPRGMDKYIQSLIDETGVTKEDVFRALVVTNLQVGPGMDDIDAKVITFQAE